MSVTSARKIAVLAGSEPDLDPRIDWTARFAPTRFERTVFGFFNSRRQRQATETRDGLYEIVRFQKERMSRIRALVWLFFLVGRRRLFHVIPLAITLMLGLLYEAPVMILWLPIAFFRKTVRFFGRLLLKYSSGVTSSDRSESSASSIYRVLLAIDESLGRLRNVSLLRPHRLLVFTDVVQDFFGTTRGLFDGIIGTRFEFDVIQACDLETLFAGTLIKERFGCRLIYDSHEFWPHADVGARRWEVLFWEIVEQNLLADVDAAFTVSQPLADVMSRRYGIKFETVPNCEPTSQPSCDDRGSSVDPIKFVFQGGFAEKRGVDFLLRAWHGAALSNAQLVLRGPDSECKSQSMALAKRLGLSHDSVVFAEPVEEDELLSALGGCSVGIVPYEPYGLNYRLCCPNKLSQYMKCGLAVLHNDLPYVESIVSAAQAGWKYDGTCLDKTVETLRAIARDRGAIQRAGDSARRFYSLEFNWQKVSVPLYLSYESSN